MDTPIVTGIQMSSYRFVTTAQQPTCLFVGVSVAVGFTNAMASDIVKALMTNLCQCALNVQLTHLNSSVRLVERMCVLAKQNINVMA